jgi:glycosyltransferase involved in cell wall biosynthesis
LIEKTINNKNKVVFFIDSFRIGGMHRQVYLIVKNLNRNRFEPIIISQSQHGGFKEQFLSLGCKSYDLGWKNRYSFFLILYRFIKVLLKEKPDNIFITQVPNFIYFLTASLFLPFKISQVGSFRAINFWLGNKGRLHLFIEIYLSRLFYKISDYVTTNSNALVSHYYSFIDIKIQKPIVRIYNGIDFEIRKFKSNKETLFNVVDDDLIVVMVARLDPMKDFDTLINAAHIVCSKEPRIKFFLLGDGELRDMIKERINQLDLRNSFFLLGEVSDSTEYLRHADISVLSTKGEGLSNTILESMFLGIPCIATAVGGNIELLENGRGILVQESNAPMLSEEILVLAKNKKLRLSLSQTAKLYLIANFGIEAMVNSYEEIFLKSRQEI